jgi:hypothetical protein
MGEVLGLGLTHFPPLGWPDQTMDRALQFAFADPSVPDAVKEGEGWPDGMREEFDRDRLAAAADHRAALVAGCDRVRAALDEFAPDVVVIWGDDQYELFREDVVPAFCVVAADALTFAPWRGSTGAAIPNVWDEDVDTQFELRGHADFGRQLAASLLHDDFDVAYAYARREDRPFPHAVANTVLFLDYHRRGFPYAVVPMMVNCYGRLAISRRGGMVRFDADGGVPQPDPPSPTPRRCIAIGRAVARAAAASDLRVALVASSSWSHGFLHDPGWRIYPDNGADRAFYESLVDGKHAAWHAATLEAIEHSGQQEMLNWFCLIGAVEEQGLELAWSDYVETHVFNSNKCFAVFR